MVLFDTELFKSRLFLGQLAITAFLSLFILSHHFSNINIDIALEDVFNLGSKMLFATFFAVLVLSDLYPMMRPPP